MHCVDLGESFPTHIYLQKSASIQPRTSPVKFARSPCTDPPGSTRRRRRRVGNGSGAIWSQAVSFRIKLNWELSVSLPVDSYESSKQWSERFGGNSNVYGSGVLKSATKSSAHFVIYPTAFQLPTCATSFPASILLDFVWHRSFQCSASILPVSSRASLTWCIFFSQ